MHFKTLGALIWIGTVSAFPVRAGQDDAKPAKKWTQSELETISREIQRDLERLRGEEFSSPVAVKVSSKADLIEYMKVRSAKTDPPAKLAADEQVAKMLGVVDPGLDVQAKLQQLLESQVAGFYDPDTKSFSLMETLPVGLTKITLAHELDHALDDQLFDLDGHIAALGNDTDTQFAFQAVVEGSGTAVMTEWMMSSGNVSELLGSVSDQQRAELSSMAGAPPWLWKPLLGCYITGGAFLLRTDNWLAAQQSLAMKQGSLASADVRAAFAKPPRSTEQVLHPEKYWDPKKLDEPRAVAIDTSKIERGWQVLREDTLGEFLVAMICTPPSQRDVDISNEAAVMGLTFTNQVAVGWGGDRLVLLGNGDARVLRWVTAWDSARDAGEFYGAMTQLMPSFEAAARALSGDKPSDSGATVEYGAAEDEVVLTVRSRVSRGDLKRLLKSLQ